MSRRTFTDRQGRGIDNISHASADLLAYFEHRVRGAEAADLLSETMVTAWRRIDAMPEDPTEARMWLFGVARNVLANAERTVQRRSKLADKLRTHLNTEPPAPDGDQAIEVRAAVTRLSPDLRELIGLIHWDGFSIAEAATIIGIPSSTATTRYQTARQHLSELLTATTP